MVLAQEFEAGICATALRLDTGGNFTQGSASRNLGLCYGTPLGSGVNGAVQPSLKSRTICSSRLPIPKIAFDNGSNSRDPLLLTAGCFIQPPISRGGVRRLLRFPPLQQIGER